MSKFSFLSFFRQRTPKLCLLGFLLIALVYGGGRLYYRVTDGFLESNIVYDMGLEPKWNTAPLAETAKQSLKTILSQPFYYLGKGCQSYVFASEDRQYVIKFVKYQRFRPPEWLDAFASVPYVNDYRLKKIAKKKKKLDNLFSSWKLAYEELQPETGIIYVHFNKTDDVDQSLTVYDKLGFKHELQLKGIEFMLQKKIDMLCPALLKQKERGDLAASKALIDRLFGMLLSEYERGLADNDHALMQNTGVDQGQPIHVDVGQFIKNPTVSDPSVYNQELINKTWKFRKWLEINYPQLADYTLQSLKRIIGPQFDRMQPVIDKSSMGRIQNEG